MTRRRALVSLLGIPPALLGLDASKHERVIPDIPSPILLLSRGLRDDLLLGFEHRQEVLFTEYYKKSGQDTVGEMNWWIPYWHSPPRSTPSLVAPSSHSPSLPASPDEQYTQDHLADWDRFRCHCVYLSKPDTDRLPIPVPNDCQGDTQNILEEYLRALTPCCAILVRHFLEKCVINRLWCAYHISLPTFPALCSFLLGFSCLFYVSFFLPIKIVHNLTDAFRDIIEGLIFIHVVSPDFDNCF
jgi:hypothetical protein